MKREIKFRAWDRHKKVFIDSDVYAVINRTAFGAFGVMIKDWEDYKEGEFFYDEAQKLAQFTGLHDKNGKEIYEGDILTYNQYLYNSHNVISKMDIVEYSQCGFCLKEDGSQWFIGDNKNAGRTDFEVIGNIYEHNHLLK